MGGCQNYGPFVGPYYNTAPIIYGTPKRDLNFDNHPISLEPPACYIQALNPQNPKTQSLDLKLPEP